MTIKRWLVVKRSQLTRKCGEMGKLTSMAYPNPSSRWSCFRSAAHLSAKFPRETEKLFNYFFLEYGKEQGISCLVGFYYKPYDLKLDSLFRSRLHGSQTNERKIKPVSSWWYYFRDKFIFPCGVCVCVNMPLFDANHHIICAKNF